MIVRFTEDFSLSIDELFQYFRTPDDWTRIFGFPRAAHKLKDDWYQVPLKHFPFPLVTKYVFSDPPHQARWIFRGFWHGHGEVHLTSTETGCRIEGFEEVRVGPLGPLSGVVERFVLQQRFQRIWDIGWYRLRRSTVPGSSGGDRASNSAGTLNH